jgi:HSP20 family protein
VFDELDRALNSVFGKDFFPTSLSRSAYPKMNIYEDNGKLHVDAYVPEVSKDRLKLTVDDDVLTIEGSTDKEKKVEDGKYYCREVSKRSFSRSVKLPEGVNSGKIEAEHRDGMLKVSMPYIAEKDKQKTKLIDIK